MTILTKRCERETDSAADSEIWLDGVCVLSREAVFEQQVSGLMQLVTESSLEIPIVVPRLSCFVKLTKQTFYIAKSRVA